jgi:preprotein translocase subunit SecG
MFTVLVILHILVSLFLIFVVLVQGGRGAELGAAFGGSSQTLFGGRGAATFLNKLTTVVAIVFMLTSLSLTFISLKSSGSIVKGAPVQQKQQPGAGPGAGAVPGQPAAPIAPAPQKAPAGPAAK